MASNAGEWGTGFDDDNDDSGIPNFNQPKIGKISKFAKNSQNKRIVFEKEIKSAKINSRNKYKHLSKKDNSSNDNNEGTDVKKTDVNDTTIKIKAKKRKLSLDNVNSNDIKKLDVNDTKIKIKAKKRKPSLEKETSPDKPSAPKKSKNKYMHLAGVPKRVSIDHMPNVESQTSMPLNKKKHRRAKKKRSETSLNVEKDNKVVNNVLMRVKPTDKEGKTPDKSNNRKDKKKTLEISDSKICHVSDKINKISKVKKVKKELVSSKKVNASPQKLKCETKVPKQVVEIVTKINDTKRSKEKNAKSNTFDKNKLKRMFDDVHDSETSPKKMKVGDESQSTKKKKKEKMGVVEKMRNDLQASRFRYLNEQLYTCTGEEAFHMMQNDTQSFKIYHDGFQTQVEKWPRNPLDDIIAYVKKRSQNLLVADFGCGDAKLADSVPNKVHSFDLVAVNEKVTACNMAKVPLGNNKVDIAVFCLSLMGTDIVAFLTEANRVLKKGGVLKIAEVASRFESVKKFTKRVEKMGFSLKDKDHDTSSKSMFLMFEFVKTEEVSELPDITLLPCIYKKR